MDWKKISYIIGCVFKILPWIGTIFGIHQWLYNKSPKYYFIIKKFLQSWKDTKWNVTVSYIIDKDIDAFNIIENSIKSQFEKFYRTFNLKNKKQFQFGNFSMLVQYDLDFSVTDKVKVEILFTNMNVTYKNAKQRLKELRILFNNFEKNLSVKNQEYCMDIYFTDLTNPFYGLMIQRLGDDKVKDFECLFPLKVLEFNKRRGDNSDKYFLRVFKDKITINEVDFSSIEDIASKCLLVG